jgi:hypothetical protein
MDILINDLKAVEKLGLCLLNFCDRVFCKVFVYNAIAGRKKGQHMLHKMAFPIV